jgi:hypothetical protein
MSDYSKREGGGRVRRRGREIERGGGRIQEKPNNADLMERKVWLDLLLTLLQHSYVYAACATQSPSKKDPEN